MTLIIFSLLGEASFSSIILVNSQEAMAMSASVNPEHLITENVLSIQCDAQCDW